MNHNKGKDPEAPNETRRTITCRRFHARFKVCAGRESEGTCGENMFWYHEKCADDRVRTEKTWSQRFGLAASENSSQTVHSVKSEPRHCLTIKGICDPSRAHPSGEL
jgi:hypothetical protein